jgi:hypothetical protein
MFDATMIGTKLVDRDGGLIGRIEDLVVDPRSLVCEWVKVRFGILRDRTLVPIGDVPCGARRPAAGALSRNRVRSAPPVHDRNLDAATRHRLMRYYGLDDPA